MCQGILAQTVLHTLVDSEEVFQVVVIPHHRRVEVGLRIAVLLQRQSVVILPGIVAAFLTRGYRHTV